MNRIIIHWTGGKDRANTTDIKHYHYIINRDGTVTTGKYKPEDNLDTSTHYAAHTRGCNADSIGIALSGMYGAKEHPLDVGDYPITQEQIDTLARLAGALCLYYVIPVTNSTVLTHAEVEGRLRVKQNNKWDITWLPGMTVLMSAPIVGAHFRALIRKNLYEMSHKNLT